MGRSHGDTVQSDIRVWKQLQREERVNGKVDIAVTDSPLALSIYYDPYQSENLQKLVLEVLDRRRCFNIFLKRTSNYESTGRLQTEEEAIEIDNQIEKLLIKHNIDYFTLECDEQVVNKISAIVLNQLSLPKQLGIIQKFKITKI